MKMMKTLFAVAAAVLAMTACAKSTLKTLVYGDGDTLEPEDSIFFTIDEFPETIGAYSVLEDFLPMGIEAVWTGKKLKTAAKAGRVKYSKADEDFVTTNDDNPCGFKVSYNKKKGTVSGSFKVYVQKSEKKLKTYTAKFSGAIGGTIVVKIGKTAVAYATFE